MRSVSNRCTVESIFRTTIKIKAVMKDGQSLVKDSFTWRHVGKGLKKKQKEEEEEE